MKHPQNFDTTPEISKRMSNVKTKRGEAETRLAKALWQKGYRYRLNYKELPGSPDIAITKYKIAVFVDGEYWHGKDWETRKPNIKKNREYWIEKIEENIARDKRVNQELESIGWRPIRIWSEDIKKDLSSCVKDIEDEILQNSISDSKKEKCIDDNDTDNKKLSVPDPILDIKEQNQYKSLKERHEKLTEPSLVSKASSKVKEWIPQAVKDYVGDKSKELSETEIIKRVIIVTADLFKWLETNAAKVTISERKVISEINKQHNDLEISCLQEVCFAREYDIEKLVKKYKKLDIFYSVIEGGATGAFGFAGLPANLALSMFLFYRAVQSIAMYYGYDVKNDPDELIIASDVFTQALSPSTSGDNATTDIVAKIWALTETTTVRQLSKKTWAEMAEAGGIPLLLCQLRALANKYAQKALEKVGKKQIEHSIFTNVLKQIGKNLTKKAIGTLTPVVGGLIGAAFDSFQMKTVLEYANVFYGIRFIAEKEARINEMLGLSESVDTIIDTIQIEEDDINDFDYIIEDESAEEDWIEGEYVEEGSSEESEILEEQ